VELAGFRKFLAEYHAKSDHPWVCLPHWCCRTVLPDGVILKPFFTKMVYFYMHVCRKNDVPLHRKILLIWCNFKRFSTILNSKILLNIMRKMKYLTDQLQLVSVLH